MLMASKRSCFFNLDILSNPPSLRIFGNYNYKTTWSTLISIIVMIFSFGFALYASLEFCHFEQPNIFYLKTNSYNKTLSLNLNEILLMFKIGHAYIDDINIYENISLRAEIFNFDINSSYEYEPKKIKLEKCELNKNINNKYEDTIKEFESSDKEKTINDYYCINKEDSEKYSLYYSQNIGYNYLSVTIYNSDLNEQLNIKPESLRIYLVLESDFIAHNIKKRNPIITKYIETYSSNFNHMIFGTTVFDLNYIEYDSDDGIIFEKINTYKGLRLNSETQEFFFQNMSDNSSIGRIKIRINKNTYDKYRRNYTKLQELLSEIESIINLFFIVGRILALIIDRKKMNLDLSRVLMNKKTEINNGDFRVYENNISFNKIFGKIDDIKNSKNQIKKCFSLDNKIIKKDNPENNNIIKEKEIIKKVILKNMDNNLMNEIVMKKIHIYHILKSYFCCFKDKTTKLINFCNDVILDELSIDKILSRIFKLEKIYYLLSETDKAKVHYMHIKELEGINEYLNNEFCITTDEEKFRENNT